MRILVVGSLVWDALVGPVAALDWETTSWVESASVGLGGNGGTTAFSIARLGGTVGLLSARGTDGLGQLLHATLQSEGVECSGIQILPGPTAFSVGLYHPDGRRQLFHAPGVGAQAEFTLPPGYDHLHVANPFALPFLRRHAPALLQAAKDSGLTTSLDLGWDRLSEWRAVVDPCLPFVDLLFANAAEAERIPGPYPCCSIIKLGAGGCLVDGVPVPGFAVPAVDTTGAGDSFCGAFLAAQARGLAPLSAARSANAFAARGVTQPGATPGLLDWAATEAWIAHLAASVETLSLSSAHGVTQPGLTSRRRCPTA